MLARLRKWFGFTTAEDDLVDLVRVAQEDPQIRQHLLLILEQPTFQRQSLINSWIEELRLVSAPVSLIRALAALTDDDRARITQEILSQETEVRASDH
ncbi:MAG: hypothetical protein ACFHX7_10335 [Pseudomonadota bacterium]